MSLTEKIYNKIVEKKMDGKTPVIIDNTLASVNLIKSKIEKNLFFMNLATSIIFLAFYGYMIYSNIVSNGIARIIVYISLTVILIISMIFDIMFYPGKARDLSFIAKKKMKQNKKLKRNIVLSIKVIIKAFSLGYALYEIVSIDSSTSKVILLALSAFAFVFQIIFYFISDLVVKYADYLILGIHLDIENSGAYVLINKDGRDIIKANQQLRDKEENAMIEEIQAQAEIDKRNRLNDVALKKQMVNKEEEKSQ